MYLCKIPLDSVAQRTQTNYNIASRAAQSNSVYVNVLKIPIVLADGPSNFFSRERPLLARGKIFYFAIIVDINRDSTH